MEFDEIMVKESPGLCRCCLSEGCYKDMGTEYSWMNENEVYAEMLLECFDISISQHNEGPNGPNRLICEVCITRLRDACYFKKQVLDSEKKFVDMVGRGEFKTKVMIYNQSMMKSESAEEVVAEPVEVEYLEDDMDFIDDDMPKAEDSEPTGSEVTADPLPVRSKRGRPRKSTLVKPEKKKVKVEKGKSKSLVKEIPPLSEDISQNPRKEDLIKILRVILQNSTIMPFRWSSNNFMCFFCGCPFIDCSSLKQHTKLEHENPELKSVFTFFNIERVKLDISEISCKRCPKAIASLDDFLNHAVSAHNLQFNRALSQYFFSFKLTDNDLNCLDCGETFKFFGSLLVHAHKYHNKSSTFLCEICGLGFVSKQNVANHIRQIHKKSECDMCHKMFSSQYAMTVHFEKVHKQDKLKCPICPEILGSRYLKKRHLALVHSEQSKQYKCEECSKIFTVRSKLLEHLGRIHLKEKRVACEICGFKVFNKAYLNKHMVKHDDSRPFQCDICKKSFQRRKTLELHKRIHTNDRRYACKECGKAFVQVTSLKLHVKVHHSSNDTPAWS